MSLKIKRNKGLTIMFLPIFVSIFIMGFCMYCLGEKRETIKTKTKPLENDSIRIMPIVFEENKEIISA
jgi:hypothetical protein